MDPTGPTKAESRETQDAARRYVGLLERYPVLPQKRRTGIAGAIRTILARLGLLRARA